MKPFYSAVIAFGLCAALLMLGSCRCADKGRFFGVGALLCDPFEGPDHVALGTSVALDNVMDKHIRPVTTVTGNRALTLQECRRLALGKNLEIQQSRFEQFTQQAIENSNKKKLLPHLFFDGELSDRDNPLYSYSEILGREGEQPVPGGFGTGVNQYSTGRERSTWRYAMELRWSPTDAALAYYLTRSSRNDKRKQHYITVRIAQRLLGVVDSSYHRLLSLQKVLPMCTKLVGMRRQAVQNMEGLFNRNLETVEEVHRLRQKLIKARNLEQRLRNEAEQQRNLLATAIYVSPDYCADGGFYLTGDLKRPCFNECMSTLVMTAMKNRPEALRAALEHLSSINDLKRTIVKFFPKVSGFWRFSRDKDKHLYNRDWKEVGMLIHFDLLEWGANLDEHKATQMQNQKTFREIGAVALGITSEVRKAALRYYAALDQITSAERSLEATKKVVEIQRRRTETDAQKRLSLLEGEADLLNEQIERERAIGEAMGQLAELQSTTGTNYNEPLAR